MGALLFHCRGGAGPVRVWEEGPSAPSLLQPFAEIPRVAVAEGSSELQGKLGCRVWMTHPHTGACYSGTWAPAPSGSACHSFSLGHTVFISLEPPRPTLTEPHACQGRGPPPACPPFPPPHCPSHISSIPLPLPRRPLGRDSAPSHGCGRQDELACFCPSLSSFFFFKDFL